MIQTTVKTESGRAADAIAQVLETEIVTGVLPADSPLPVERVLIERFGTSRTVIRQAILILSGRGLVESKPRFRPVVRKPGYQSALEAMSGVVKLLLVDEKGQKNLFDSRVLVERTLVRDAALRATHKDIQNLRKALEANYNAIGDSTEFYRTDIEFHRALYCVGDNPIFSAVHEAYTSWLKPHWISTPHSSARNEANYNAHETIMDAILNRNPDAADTALEAHLNASWEGSEFKP
jgi:DNA-binding FadR family transcriptional regulator